MNPRRTWRRRLTSWFVDAEYDRKVAAEQLAHVEMVRAVVAERMRQRRLDEEAVAAEALALACPGEVRLISWVDAGDGSARGLASWLPDGHPALG